MSNWQERITHETAPAIRVEHELRYRLAAPLIIDCETWADLGCGSGVAAAAALGKGRPPSVVLVDVDEASAAVAAAELAVADATLLRGDLTDPDALNRIESALLAGGGDRVVTCFEVIEHLATFLPLVEWCGRLARDANVTFAISVPNDAFWSIENPHHQTMWSAGAFDQLLRLLPDQRTVMRQVALSGSAIVAAQGQREAHEIVAVAGGPDAVATHFIAAFGPRHAEVAGGALAVETDLLAQRRWERERDSNLALAEAAVNAQSATIYEQQEQLRSHVVQFEEWRAYIHRLEQDLGIPLAGQPDQAADLADVPASDAAESSAASTYERPLTGPPEDGQR